MKIPKQLWKKKGPSCRPIFGVDRRVIVDRQVAVKASCRLIGNNAYNLEFGE
jgi:hypothetical protein